MDALHSVLAHFPGRFSRELGLDLASGPDPRQQWFLAAILFGARISGALAVRTFKVFQAQGVYAPAAIREAGWDRLVELLDAGGYARYDFKTATKLLQVMAALRDRYQDDLESLHRAAADPADLEARIMGLAPGIGPVTVNIFLRELRGIWTQARPPLASLAQEAAVHLGLLPTGQDGRQALQALEAAWNQRPLPPHTFADLEAALVRLGRDFCRKPGKGSCPLGSLCPRHRSKLP